MDVQTTELLDIAAACRFIGGSKPINRVTLYRGIQSGRYPRPVKSGPNTSRWLKSELQSAIDSAIKARAE